MSTTVLAVVVLGIMGAVFGLVLGFAAKIFHVDVDPKVAAVRECLAGANCGGCGFPGCDGYAAAVAAGKAPTNKCVAGGAAAAAKVAEVMGVEATAAVRKVAFVPCSGENGVAARRFNYSGPQNCQSAMLFGGRDSKECRFACVGLGNCLEACKFGALSIVNGVAKVDREKCVGCGACTEVCPKKMIRLVPYNQKVLPTCSSKDKGAVVMKVCDAGCIGCMKCQRECEAGAITVTDNLATIDSSKCTQCGHCAEICPRHIIKPQKS
jgi:Na+-translocating ferredoxin:NAD+ oxidoreductase subunit B